MLPLGDLVGAGARGETPDAATGRVQPTATGVGCGCNVSGGARQTRHAVYVAPLTSPHCPQTTTPPPASTGGGGNGENAGGGIA